MEVELNSSARRSKFLKKLDLDEVNGDLNSLQLTSHPNLLNLMRVSVIEDGIYLHYERPGVSLSKMKQFKLIDRIAVATICKKVIQGLIYVHDVLNIVHGNLHCDNTYLNEDGEIKIGDIGQSMMQARDTKDISREVEAVYDIAESLLSLDGSADERSLSWVMANDFVKSANGISLKTLSLTVNCGAPELMNV
ncbi:conserved hypothetical protein [Talaromyces stipitatus ATCC 10500]|uniref:Protein kinase domain-containing protein n=1 Tax=Talaromyces stipitatus (strain ATCC 10500 / CBS 375.48 / QM 6759 / NRRL 1006) TaxID=441959 RepID=B8LZZ8_TALSN|nr:uncharacterized protein TSTA_081630 [Talaromyces stipitatus ATCC 10500]EED20930.1 conserved hypothetical protein [Talaromyces stipitatus ATCC 10500]